MPLYSRSISPSCSFRRAPAPWLVGVLAFGFGLAWFLLIGMAFVPAASFQSASPLVPIGFGLAWVGLGLAIVRWISTAAGWGDRQRLALIFGALLASMLGGVLEMLTAAPIDIIGKTVIDLAAIVLLARFAAVVRKRQDQTAPA
jgi:hypothetical protein